MMAVPISPTSHRHVLQRQLPGCEMIDERRADESVFSMAAFLTSSAPAVIAPVVEVFAPKKYS